MAILSWEDGIVKIDSLELPGYLKNLSADCKIKCDEQDVDGQSGKKRTPLGWEDTEVTITLLLDTENRGTDCYEKLEIINGIFRGHDSNANPKVFDVDNRHLLARGVSRLIFNQLKSDETDADDTINAVLTFVEYNPPVVKTETNVAKNAQDKAKKNKEQKEAQNQPCLPDVDAVDGPSIRVSLK